MIIAIDFDGTIVTHEYPLIGKDIGAFPVIKRLQEKGHKIILYTMRSGSELQEAINFCSENEIVFYGVNKNPTQYTWTNSSKVYAHLYIDDSALGVPLVKNSLQKRPYVDWKKIKEYLIERQII